MEQNNSSQYTNNTVDSGINEEKQNVKTINPFIKYKSAFVKVKGSNNQENISTPNPAMQANSFASVQDNVQLPSQSVCSQDSISSPMGDYVPNQYTKQPSSLMPQPNSAMPPQNALYNPVQPNAMGNIGIDQYNQQLFDWISICTLGNILRFVYLKK